MLGKLLDPLPVSNQLCHDRVAQSCVRHVPCYRVLHSDPARHPLDRVLVGGMEAHEDVTAILKRLKIGDVHTPAAALERVDVTAGGDDTDFTSSI